MKSTLTIAAGFEKTLGAAGLDRFERLMAFQAPASAVTRAVPGRFTVRVELSPAPEGCAGVGAADGGGAERLVVFLKRYRGLLRAPAAALEWRRLQEAAATGIPCPEPVALGERRGLFGATESLLATREIAGAAQADWWIRDHGDRRSDLVGAVGRLARRFHEAGFHHQDLYLCHFFVREGAAGGLDLFLIDLQRCGRLGVLRRRWIVKDLAQVHFSLGQAGFGREHWEGFLQAYGPRGRELEAAILRKSRRIARHVPRYG